MYDPAEVDALDREIRALVVRRSEMVPNPSVVPPDDPAQGYRADNLMWNVRPAPDAAALELGLYHSGLGWVTMLLSRAQIEDLNDAMTFALRALPAHPSRQGDAT